MAPYAIFCTSCGSHWKRRDAVLVLRWVAVCINDSLAATGHAVYEVVESAGGQRSPNLPAESGIVGLRSVACEWRTTRPGYSKGSQWN